VKLQKALIIQSLLAPRQTEFSPTGNSRSKYRGSFDLTESPVTPSHSQTHTNAQRLVIQFSDMLPQMFPSTEVYVTPRRKMPYNMARLYFRVGLL